MSIIIYIYDVLLRFLFSVLFCLEWPSFTLDISNTSIINRNWYTMHRYMKRWYCNYNNTNNIYMMHRYTKRWYFNYNNTNIIYIRHSCYSNCDQNTGNLIILGQIDNDDLTFRKLSRIIVVLEISKIFRYNLDCCLCTCLCSMYSYWEQPTKLFRITLISAMLVCVLLYRILYIYIVLFNKYKTPTKFKYISKYLEKIFTISI